MIRLAVFVAFLSLVNGRNLDQRDGLISIQTEQKAEPVSVVKNIVTTYNYPYEEHSVYTADGYILTVHRIPYSPKSKSRGKKPVVFVQHGLLCSSADWVVMGPEKGLAFLLADLGYDVWMGNARGSTYSRNHTFIDPSKAAFWDFSWHEIGIHDIPSMIDYALAHTGEKDLHYIGHSQGTTSFFVMCSERPDYNAKIRSMQALAPVAFMSNLASPVIRLMSANVNSLEWLAKMIGLNEVLASTDFLTLMGDLFCDDTAMTQPVCSNILFLISGFNAEQLNTTALPAIFENTPAGASANQLIHYSQEVNSAKFQQLDLGKTKNLAKYGTPTPPDYKLDRVTAPVFLHYSDNDWLSHPKDVDELAHKLGNNMGKYRVTDPKFSHLDFLWAIDGPSIVYSKVFNFMARYD